MTDTEKAYVAGLIDGEGTITLSGSNLKWGKNGIYYYPLVQIANSNQTMIDWVEKRTDNIKHGSYYYNRKPDKQKPTWLLQYRGKSAFDVLEEVKEYLVSKRRQADIIWEYWIGSAAWNQSKRGHWNSKHPMPQEVRDLRVELFTEIRALNKRGPI